MSKTKYDEFTQNLILVMLGVELENFSEQEQDEIVFECMAIYNQYIVEYFASHFPEIDNTKINILDLVDKNNQSITLGLVQKIQAAYQSFIQHLEETWAQ
jgi:hypothetical protein